MKHYASFLLISFVLTIGSAADAAGPRAARKPYTGSKSGPMATLKKARGRIVIRQTAPEQMEEVKLTEQEQVGLAALMKAEPKMRAIMLASVLAEQYDQETGQLKKGSLVNYSGRAALAATDPKLRMEALHLLFRIWGVRGADGEVHAAVKSKSGKEDRRWLVDRVIQGNKDLLRYPEIGIDPAEYPLYDQAIEHKFETEEAARPDTYLLSNNRVARRMVEEIMSPGTTTSVEEHATWYPGSNEFHIEVEGGLNLVYKLPEAVTAAAEKALNQPE